MRPPSRDFKVAWAIPTWSSPYLQETWDSIPEGETREVIDTKALGWPLSRAWNFAAHKYLVEQSYDAVILANDDISVRGDTGQMLAWGLLEAQHDPDHLTISAQGPNGKLLLVTCYQTNEDDNGPGHPEEGCRWGVGAPDYSCFAIGRAYLQQVGWFDESFNPCYFEDNDSHYRIRLAGYEAAQWTPYRHRGGSTVKNDPERRDFIVGNAFERCREYYQRKWGGEPGRERFRTPFNGLEVRSEERVIVAR